MNHWKDYATRDELARLSWLAKERDYARAELQTIRKRCAKRMERDLSARSAQ